MNIFDLRNIEAEGYAQRGKNGKESSLKENQVFITEPALLFVKSNTGARLMGIQIKTRETEE